LFSAQAGTWTHAVNSNANAVPTVANGKVYVASNKQLQIFGLLPPQGSPARAALPHPPAPSQPDAVTCAPSGSPLAAVDTAAPATHQFYGTVCRVSGSELQLSLRSGRSIAIDVSQAFARHQRLALTPGRVVHVTATINGKGAAHAVRISPAHTLSPLTPADR